MHEIGNSCICREIFVIVEINVMVYPNISCWYFSLIANPRFVYLTTGKEIAKAAMFALFDSVSDRQQRNHNNEKVFFVRFPKIYIWLQHYREEEILDFFFIALYFVLSQTVIQLKNVRKTKYMNKVNQKSTLKIISLISQGGPTCLLAWERTI